ncbi:MAG: serine/threonine protein kinase, partial [Planctomycetales bacterium]
MIAAISTTGLEDCPESAVLQRYLLGRLPGDEFESVDLHVSSCDSCCDAIRHCPPELDELTSQLSRIPSDTDFGDYELILQLGRGGMGYVYRARHRKLGQDFALKVIHPDLQNDPHFTARFEREIQTLGKVNSPNVVQPMHAGEWQGTSFVVMELVDGCDLETLVREQGVLNPADAAEVIAQMAIGLDAIHSLGLVHRDLHPGNVLLSRHGQIKIGDLGLITAMDQFDDPIGLTNARDRVGAKAFMAPEQRSRPDAVTPAADLFSLGCVWYYLLTGRSLTREPLTHQITRRRECLKSIPRSCRALMTRLLGNEPDQRPGCATEVVETLKPMRRKARLVELFREPPAHSPLLSGYAIAAGAGAGVLLTAIGFSAWPQQDTEPAVSPYHEQAPTVIRIPYEQGGSLVRQFYFEAFPDEYTLELIDDREALLSKGRLSTWWYMDCVGNPTDTRIAISERSPRPSVTVKLQPGTHKISVMSVRADPHEVSGDQITRLVDHVGVIFYVYPDLALQSCAVSTEHICLGEQLIVSLELTNRGTVDANPGILRVFLNPVEPSFLSGQITEFSYPALAAGISERIHLPVHVANDFPT